MKTLRTIHENELSEMEEKVYNIPTQAIKQYLETDSDEAVDKFLRSEYISDDTERILDLCDRNGIKYEEVIHPDDEERPLNFYDYLGGIYDHDYGIYDECYSNVENFINHIAKMEVDSAIKDSERSGENVEDDEMYIRFKRLIDNQTISKNELDEIMDMCNYFFRKKKLEIVEIDVKGENQPFVFYSIDEAKKSALDWIKAQIDMYGSQIDPELEASYIKAIQELPLVDSVKGLNEAVANLINYKYIVWYEMLYRPISPGCQPKGFCQYNFDVGRHGIVAYERELTEDELDKYEMREFVL